MMRTCFLFVLLMLIRNGLAFRTARQNYKKPGLSPLSLFMKRVGWSLSSLDKKICDAQADIDEIEDELEKPIDRIDNIEITLFGAQNSGLDGRNELASDDGLVSEVDKIKGKQDNDILGPGGLKGDVLALQTDCCGEAVLGQDIADLQMDCCDEGDMRLTSLEMTVDDDTTGLVKKVAALEDDLDKDGGVLDCLVDLKTTVDTATTGLVDKVAALELKQDDLCDITKALLQKFNAVQCLDPHLFTDARKSANNNVPATLYFCDTTDTGTHFPNTIVYDEWKGDGWYRFTGPSFSRMPDNTDPLTLQNSCGTAAPGYMDDTHPTNVFETKAVKFCFNRDNDPCKWFTFGKVTNCGSFYIYYLVNVAIKLPVFNQCNIGYCGTDQPLP